MRGILMEAGVPQAQPFKTDAFLYCIKATPVLSAGTRPNMSFAWGGLFFEKQRKKEEEALRQGSESPVLAEPLTSGSYCNRSWKLSVACIRDTMHNFRDQSLRPNRKEPATEREPHTNRVSTRHEYSADNALPAPISDQYAGHSQVRPPSLQQAPCKAHVTQRFTQSHLH